MGVTLVEELFNDGDAEPAFEYLRTIAGLDPSNIIRAIRVSAAGNITLGSSSGASDTYARARGGLSFPLFDRKQLYAKDSIFFTENIAGGGTSTFSLNNAAVLLAVGTASGDRVTRQSKIYMPLEMGRSQLGIAGFLFAAGKTNLRQRVGMFDVNDGIFLELNGTSLSIVNRTSTSGAPVDTTHAQASWNIDKLDGTGPSGLTLDVTKIQVIILNFDTLGRATVSFIIDGEIFSCHTIDTANNLILPWVRVAIVPVRWEIENTGVTASSSTMNQYGTAVFNEGGTELTGQVVSANLGVIGRTVTAAAALPLLAVRLKTGFTRGVLEPIFFELMTTSAQNLFYQLITGVSIVGGAWVSLSAATELNITATTPTGGTVVKSGYFDGNNRAGGALVRSPLLTSSDFSGTADILAIVTQSISGSANTLASLELREII
jgi:hypothetical protein